VPPFRREAGRHFVSSGGPFAIKIDSPRHVNGRSYLFQRIAFTLDATLPNLGAPALMASATYDCDKWP
jgi:hypothetical protein